MQAVKQAVGLSSPRIGYLGLGNIGKGITKNLAEKGTFTGALTIWNRTQSKTVDHVATLPAGKAEVGTSIVDVVEKSDIIFSCLSNDNVMLETINEALKASSVKGKLFVDNSTIGSETSDQIAKTLNNAGADFVADPVFGAPPMAQSGQLVCVLAGPKKAVDRVKPFIKGVIARAIIDFSDQPQGNATRLKIVGNTFILGMIELLAEGHVLAEKSGVGRDNYHQFIEAMFPGPITAYSDKMRHGAYYKQPPGLDVDLARKDAGHGLRMAKDAGVNLGVLKIADEHLKIAKERQGELGDISSMYGAVREESGLPYQVE